MKRVSFMKLSFAFILIIFVPTVLLVQGVFAQEGVKNPYDVERTWPPYFLESRKHSVEEQGTHQAGDHPVYTVAVPGGWLGNSTFIVGDEGVIVYDTSINVEAGAHILKEIRKVTDKPIKAIFYSHHHTDHYNGTSALVSKEQVESGEVEIYAWDNFETEVANEFGEILPRQALGIMYYGPDFLPEEEKHHHGGAPALKILGGKGGYIPPTKTFSEDTTLEIEGVKLNVFYTGGEAISEFGIHLPQFDMVIIADEFFYGIPNTHSIRGSKPRLPENYIKAADRVIEIGPEWIIGSHIIPLQGKDEIRRQITVYRDATQYLWDQSIRHINKGYTPVELQHALTELPEHLISPPFSVPMYGTPITAVPEFFTGWVSWFNGDSTDLFPSEPVSQATRFVELMGGRDRVLDEAKKALKDGDPQFAAELARLLVRIDNEDEDARLVKAAALRARGYQQVNPIARSWYLHGAMELEGRLDPAELQRAALHSFERTLPTKAALQSWRYILDADAAGADHLVVGFRVTNTGEEAAVEIRNSVLLTHDSIPSDAGAVVNLTLEQLNTAGRAGGSFEGLSIEGDAATAQRLLDLLDREPSPFYMHLK